MPTILRNLGDVPTADSFMSGIVNRESALEKRLKASRASTAYGAEKKIYRKSYQDDRNRYEKSEYGFIPYTGLGAPSGKKKKLKTKKPTKNTTARAKPISALTKPAPKSALAPSKLPVIKAARKAQKRKEKYNESLGSVSNFAGVANFGAVTNFAGGDFGDYGLGAKKKAAPKKAAPKPMAKIAALAKSVIAPKSTVAIVAPSGNPVVAAAEPTSLGLIDKLKANLLPVGIGGAVLLGIIGFVIYKKTHSGKKSTQQSADAAAIKQFSQARKALGGK